MQEVLLVIHLMLAIAIVITVLLQRSEGGALGMGGGGGGITTARILLRVATATAADSRHTNVDSVVRSEHAAIGVCTDERERSCRGGGGGLLQKRSARRSRSWSRHYLNSH